MKKTILCLLLLVLCLSLPAAAYETQRSLDLVVDETGTLSSEELLALNDLAEQLTEQYDCEVIAVLLTDPADYGYSSVEMLAEQVYLQFQYGAGSEQSGTMLLICVDSRDYDLLAYGYGNTVFTDFGKDRLTEAFLPELGSNDWYGGVYDYIEACGEYLHAAAAGAPIDVGRQNPPLLYVAGRGLSGSQLALAVGIGLLASLFSLGVMRSQMRSAKLQKTANSYVPSDGVRITQSSDRFLRKSVTRTPISSSSSSGGKGGTSVNSRGFSHRSGKF